MHAIACDKSSVVLPSFQIIFFQTRHGLDDVARCGRVRATERRAPHVHTARARHNGGRSMQSHTRCPRGRGRMLASRLSIPTKTFVPARSKMRPSRLADCVHTRMHARQRWNIVRVGTARATRPSEAHPRQAHGLLDLITQRGSLGNFEAAR